MTAIRLRLSVLAAAIALAWPMASAAPPAPLPAKCYTGPFRIFFDERSDALGKYTGAIMARAASEWRLCPDMKIEVVGHADTREHQEIGQQLSERRALVVKRALVHTENIPEAQVSAAGRGASVPRVMSGPSVYEPQNRRVEIHFRANP